MREYYIRREGDEDSSGPFDIDQISSLMEAGKLDAEAYFYDMESESWAPISSNQELMDTLFPKKRKLSLRTPELEAERKRQEAEEAAKAKAEAEAAAAAKEASGEAEGSADETEAGAESPAEVAVEEKEAAPAKAKKRKGKPVEEEREKLEVTRMLALAEGRADDPGGKSPRERRAAVAYWGLRFLTLLFAFSIFAMLYLEKDLVLTANAPKMARNPYVIIAAFDLLMLLFLLLQVTTVYPLLRFRAAIGAGLLTMLFYASGDPILVLSNLLLMGAIYFCSAILRPTGLIASIASGVLGMLGYLYVFFLS